MNATETRMTGIAFAKFLRNAADLVHRAADNGTTELINFDEIEATVEEYVVLFTEDLNSDEDDTADIMADEDFEMDVYDEYDEP